MKIFGIIQSLKRIKFYLLVPILIFSLFQPSFLVYSKTQDDIEKEIDQKEQELDDLEKALQEAEKYARQNPEKIPALIAKRLQAESATIASMWPNFLLRLSLDQSLLVHLEEEARWARRINLVDSGDIPNYLELIEINSLKELRPDSVTILH